MNDPLPGPRIKLARANHHLIELERAEREFFERHPCRIVFDTETEPGHKLAKIRLDAPPPEIMHVLAGELIYQLRSALDQTAVALSRLSRKEIDPSKVYFPCGDRLSDFKGKCRSYKIIDFDRDLLKQIIRLRPYDGANETLRAVFRMANIDKHMELIAIGTSGEMTGISDFTIRGGYVGLIISGPGDLNEGVVFSDLFPDGTITPNNPEAKIHVSGQITLGQSAPAYAGKPLVPFLRSMVEEFGRVHAGFEALLKARGNMPPRITYWPPETNWFAR